MPALTIGKLANAVNESVVTIRYYERIGLIPTAERSESGYRHYPDSIIPRFYFIQNAKSVGLTLKEIKTLLELEQQTELSSASVKNSIETKLALITYKIEQLNKIKDALSNLNQSCCGNQSITACPILSTLYNSPPQKP
jgi:DNA-binding transcriptional MerR regulator